MSLKNHIYKPQISFNHRFKISRNEIWLIEFIVIVLRFWQIFLAPRRRCILPQIGIRSSFLCLVLDMNLFIRAFRSSLIFWNKKWSFSKSNVSSVCDFFWVSFEGTSILLSPCVGSTDSEIINFSFPSCFMPLKMVCLLYLLFWKEQIITKWDLHYFILQILITSETS